MQSKRVTSSTTYFFLRFSFDDEPFHLKIFTVEKIYLSSLHFIHKSRWKIIQLFVKILTVNRSYFPRRHSTWHNRGRCGRAKLARLFGNSKLIGNRRCEIIDWQVDQPWKIGPPTLIPNFSTCLEDAKNTVRLLKWWSENHIKISTAKQGYF